VSRVRREGWEGGEPFTSVTGSQNRGKPTKIHCHSFHLEKPESADEYPRFEIEGGESSEGGKSKVEVRGGGEQVFILFACSWKEDLIGGMGVGPGKENLADEGRRFWL